MSNININIIEERLARTGVSFQSFFVQDFENVDILQKPPILKHSVVQGNENFNFEFCKLDHEIVSNGPTKTVNFILYFNTSIYDDNYTLGIFYDYEDEIRKLVNKKIKIKILVIAVNFNYCNYIRQQDKVEFEKEQFIKLKKFFQSNECIDSNIVQVYPFSNKKYQKDYIISLALATFSNNYNEAERHAQISNIHQSYEIQKGSEGMVLQEYADHLISGQKVTTLEIYEKFSNIDYTPINQILNEKLQMLKQSLDSSQQMLKEDYLITLYNNFECLYKVATIENNFSVSNWLIEMIEKKEDHDQQFIVIPDYKKLSKLDAQLFLISKIFECGDAILFKSEFEKRQSVHQDDGFKTLQSLFKVGAIFFPSALSSLKNGKNIIQWLMEVKNESFQSETKIYWQTGVLLKCACSNDLETFKYILNHKNFIVPLNSSSLFSESSSSGDSNVILLAAQNGSLEILKYIYEEKDFNVNHCKSKSNGMKSIHYAAQNFKKDVLDYLVEIGENINITDDTGATPLYYACDTYNKYNNVYKLSKVLYPISFCEHILKNHNAKKSVKLTNGKKVNLKDKYLDSSSCKIN